MKTMVLSLATVFLAANVTLAAHCGPRACGCSVNVCCGKTTQVVCEMKKVKKTVWAVECEEFSTLLPGCHCLTGCNKCCVTPPRCDKVRTRKKLVKKTITCEVPVYKCVVVPCGEVEEAAPEAVAPEAPAPAPTPAKEASTTAPMPPILKTTFLRPIIPSR